MDGAAFPGWAIEIGHLFHAGEHPYVAILAHDAGAGFVDVQQGPTTQSFQEIVIGAGILLRRRGLEFIRRIARDVKIEQLFHARGNATLRQAELDILIYRVICKSRGRICWWANVDRARRRRFRTMGNVDECERNV